MPMNLTTPVSRVSRIVPWSTRLVVLFGGTLSWLGWVFFGFGMIFVWIFADKGDYWSAFVMRGKLDTAAAEITAVEDTHFTEGGGKHSKGTPVYAYHYRFQNGGTDFEGTSFHKGLTGRNDDAMTAEFPPDRPDRSRIRGMRRAMFGPSVGMVFLFPILGLCFILPSLLQGAKNLRLLANGETAQGRLINKVPTNVKVNGRYVYKLTFEFTDLAGQPRQAIAKTNLPEKLEANRSELVFYDPRDPANSALLDNLPGNQTLSDQGELLPCRLGTVLRTVVLPFAALVVVVGGLLVKLFR